MKFGIEVVPFGAYSDPRKIVELAQAAEAAGWEAIWIWDHVLFPYGVGDPWISLAAVASATTSIRLCTGISPMPRYRPHLLARLLTGLDVLSQGRVIFGTGLGAASDFTPFGEPGDDKTRAEMTDEGLAILEGYLSGKQFSHQGLYYTAENVSFEPTPLQKPRIPVWIGGDSPAALRRAAQWDGWIIGTVSENQEVTKTPAELSVQTTYIFQHRSSKEPFDVAVDGISAPGRNTLALEYEQAGATWWFECIFGYRGSEAEMLDRVKAGPPL
jgi:alkanesulfonate monooxygenase SsuD/methylene tetrahydromethanopterin reductase-like flavin-dependent oxidoreductase (luciferase family)